MDKKTYNRLLSRQYHEALRKVLALCEVAESQRDIYAAHMRLRELLEKVTAYRKVAILPDDVLVEMAEVLEGIYEEQDDLISYSEHMLTYLQKRQDAHRVKREAYEKQVQLDKLNTKKSKLHKLDASFDAWLYSEGYYAQRNDMYELLSTLIYQMIAFENSTR